MHSDAVTVIVLKTLQECSEMSAWVAKQQLYWEKQADLQPLGVLIVYLLSLIF